MENCTVDDMKRMAFDKNIRPVKFVDGSLEIRVSDWAELSLTFVNWLIRKGHLTKGNLPIPNHANRGKYFINSEPFHKYREKDGDWHNIGSFHIDTKYNAQAHVNNIISTLRFLRVHSPSFRITFRKY